MKRPEHDLTWSSIRYRLSSSDLNKTKHFNNHKNAHHPNGSIGNVSNNGIKSKHSRVRVLVDEATQQSDTESKMSTSLLSTVSHGPDDSHSFETNIIYSELHSIVSQLSMITDHIGRQERLDNESQDWKFVAMVIDRLCLVLFLIFTTVFSTLIFISASRLYISR